MLTIKNINNIVGRKIGINSKELWKITKININDADDYYGIVIRKESDINDYVVLYLTRNKRNAYYHISSNKSNIERPVIMDNIQTPYSFLRLLKSEIERIVC